MLDTTKITSQNITKVNFENHSASGLLCKSMVASKIIRFDNNSKLEDGMFSNNPYIVINRGSYAEAKIPIVILQVLLVSDSRYLVEYITEEDYLHELGLK